MTGIKCLEQLEVFGGEEIAQLFDDGWESDAGNDQIKLNGLAMLLMLLEDNEIGDDNSSLRIPLLCKIQALGAAYQLCMKAAMVRKVA
jgi:hypothetical protein